MQLKGFWNNMIVRNMKLSDIKDIQSMPYFSKVADRVDLLLYSYKYVAVVDQEIIGYLYAGKAERQCGDSLVRRS